MFALKDLNNLSGADFDSKSTISSQDLILNKQYTEEDAMDLIDSMCVGYSPEQATKSIDQLVNKIRNHKLEIDSSVPENIIGRNVHDFITQSIKLAGESVLACTKSNLSLEKLLTNVRSSRSSLDSDIQEMEKKLILPVQPNETYLKAKYIVEKADATALLEQEHKVLHLARLEIEDNQSVDNDDDNDSVILLRKSKKQMKKEKKQTKSSVREEPKDLEELWLQSGEYLKFQSSLAILHGKLELQFNREYVKVLNDYQSSLTNYQNVTKCIRELQDEVRKHTIRDIFINGLQSVMVSIATSVCNAIRRYPGIKTKLEGQVTLSNGERMVDPLGKMSLPGIYAILYRDYSKASLDVFCTMLLQLISDDLGYEASVNNSELGVQKILQQLRSWEQLDLYEYMSKDKLFTVALLKMYHPKSDVRIRGVTVVIEYVRRIEAGEVSAVVVGDHSDMPIFLHLIDWIERVHGVSKKFGKGDPTFTLKSGSSSASEKKVQLQQSSSNWSQKRTGGFEQAAVATVTSNAPTRNLDAKGPYNTAVERNALLMITITDGACAGHRVPYTATQSSCALCYDPVTKVKKSTGNHKPYCYNGMCNKCHLFGHKDTQCCQQLSREPAIQQG